MSTTRRPLSFLARNECSRCAAHLEDRSDEPRRAAGREPATTEPGYIGQWTDPARDGVETPHAAFNQPPPWWVAPLCYSVAAVYLAAAWQVAGWIFGWVWRAVT